MILWSTLTRIAFTIIGVFVPAFLGMDVKGWGCKGVMVLGVA